jgi:hypothetical protein
MMKYTTIKILRFPSYCSCLMVPTYLPPICIHKLIVYYMYTFVRSSPARPPGESLARAGGKPANA